MDRPVHLTARTIADALVGKRQSDGGYMCLCPAHDDKTPSLSLKDGDKGVLVYCHAGCSQEAVIAALSAKGLWPEVEPEPTREPPAAKWARRAWEKARLLDSCVAHPYFLGRGLDTRRFADLHHAIRIDPKAHHKDSDTTGPAVIVAATDNDGVVWAIQRTYLRADEAAKRGVEPARRSLGPVKGHAVRLGPQSTTIMIAEGVEDAMTGALAMDLAYGAWGCAGDKMMPNLAFPARVTEVIILSDNDAPGRKQSAIAAGVFKATGKHVRIAYPPEGTKDFNQLIEGKADAGLEAGLATVCAAIEAAEEPEAEIQIAPRSAPLPDIYLELKTPDIVDAAIAALEAAEAPIYVQSGRVVGISVLKQKTYDNEPTFARVVSEMPNATLREWMERAANYGRHTAKGMATKPVPEFVVETLKARQGQLPFPILLGAVDHPLILPSGEWLCEPGYHARLALILETNGSTYAMKREGLTREDGVAALKELDDLIKEVPFASEVDRSVMLAAMLTAVVRPALPHVPIFAFDAPVAGSGKSRLVDILSLLMTGRRAGVIAQGFSNEEFEKRVVGAALGGAPLIAIDNCLRPVTLDLLDQYATQEIVKPRALGASPLTDITPTAMVTITANNLIVKGNLTRRSLTSRLDPQSDRPELLEFATNPIEELRRGRRVRAVCAALTVLAVWLQTEGQPLKPNRPALQNFEIWDRMIRGALSWYEREDPVLSMESLRQDDPELSTLIGFIEAWIEHGEEPSKISDFVKAANATKHDTSTDKEYYANPEFRDAISAVIGAKIEPAKLGYWLRRNKGRWVKTTKGTARIVGKRQGSDHVGLWQIERYQPAGGREPPF
jgi:putative DNA primase/helicase